MTFSLKNSYKVFDVVVSEYKHMLGTNLLHFNPIDDLKQKGLMIKFNTFPTDNTGVFHILEHVILCGSKKYPIKDPFMKLVQRNLALEMNACTAQDMTYYYALSDYYEPIRDIYMDAVLNCNLYKFDFMQEGWHFNKELKGVVYNEMKGAMSDINSLYYRTLLKHLFPNTCYQFNSGGEPSAIPNLTFDAFKATYKQFYHPSNMTIMIYGNFPNINNELKYFESAISSYSKSTVPTIPYPLKIQSGTSEFYHPNKSNTFSSLYFDLGKLSYFESFCFSILSSYLLTLNQSPLYKSLIGDIGNAYTPLTGYHNSPVHFFGIGVQHQKKRDIMTHIQKLKDHKIDTSLVEVMLNQMILNYQRNTPHSGLDWMEAALSVDSDFKAQLQIDQYAKQLKQDSSILQGLLTKLINSPFHSSFMLPQVQKPIAIAPGKPSEVFTQDELDQFAIHQSKPDIVQGLPPTDPALLHHPLPVPVHNSNHTISRIVPTSLVYYYGLIQFKCPIELLSFVPLWCKTLLKLDTTIPNDQLQFNIKKYSSGISVVPVVIPDLIKNQATVKILVKSFTQNFDKLQDIIQSILVDAKWNNLHGTAMIDKTLNAMKTTKRNGLPGMGHVYAMHHANQYTSTVGSIKEKLNGLSQLNMLESLVDLNPLQLLAARIKEGHISHYITSKKGESVRIYLNKSPKTKCIFRLCDFKIETSDIPSLNLPVNYLGQSQYTVPYRHGYSALYSLYSKLMQPYLHEHIREKGGAYGGGSTYDAMGGSLNFYTYRDPNKNFEVFRDAIHSVSNTTQEQLDLAKWNILRDMDKPVSIEEKRLDLFLYGIGSKENRFKQIKYATLKKVLKLQKPLLETRVYKGLVN